MEQAFELIAKTFLGLEPILAQELTELGADNVQIGRRMVSFTGNKELMYRANFQLHTAIRILKPIKHFKASSADDVYEEVKKIDWSDYLDSKRTFAVDSVVFSEEFRHSKFVAYKVKDAIVDQFREETGVRPNVSVTNPDIRLHIHIAEDQATLCLDSSGESLHRRGYRQESVEAPLNEVLAAGMILMSGWKGETDFIDPMCGSGTLLIEATMLAYNIPAQICRESFGFFTWRDFDETLWHDVKNAARLAVKHNGEFAHKLIGYETDDTMLKAATQNIKKAMLDKYITVELMDPTQVEAPEDETTVMVVAPKIDPYNVEKTTQTVEMLSKIAKRTFKSAKVWIHTGYDNMPKALGIQPRKETDIRYGSEANKLASY